MKTTEIRRLLGKYYNGETSLEEELLLKRYFESDNIPEEFADEKAIFRYYSDALEAPEPSSGFEERIIAAVGAVEPNRSFWSFKSRLLSYSGIAAGLLILFGSYYFFIYKSEPKDTFSNPEIAYNETVKILFEVSAMLNQGTKQLDPVGKLESITTGSFSAINRSTMILENNMKNLDYFQKALEMVSSPMDYIKNK